MEDTKKTKLNLEMFKGVNYFAGLDHDNLVVDGDSSPYVPSDVKILWFRAVYPKGDVTTQMVGSLEDTIRYKLCVFNAEVYDGDNKKIGSAFGSASTDEERFIEVAERRAVGRALSNAGFTWHNGNFSFDIDVAKSCLNLYNSYINNGTLDITDIRVTQMYDDALVTVLPDGYGADTGKSIAAMDQQHLAEIAKNYAILNSGDSLVNAKIKFVYMYQLIKQESDKNPDFSPVTIEEVVEGQNEKEKPKKTRRSRKTKDASVSEPVAESAGQETRNSEPVFDTEEQETPAAVEETEKMQDMPVPAETEAVANDDTEPVDSPADNSADEEQETTANPFDTSDEQTEDAHISDDDFDIKYLEDVFNLPAQDEEDIATAESVFPDEVLSDAGTMENGYHLDSESEATSFSEMNGIGMDEEGTESQNGAFKGFTIDEAEDNPFTEDGEFDIEKELRMQQALEEWGYTSTKEVSSDWKAYMTKVRERSAGVLWSDKNAGKEYVEGILIYNNFLWPDKAEKENVVLLGDFLNEHKWDVVEAMNNDAFPLATLKNPVDWYIGHVWDEF